MATDWKTWEGRVVDGKFPLRQYVGESDHSAVFLTERLGQASPKTAIKLVRATEADSTQQLSRWHAAAQASHPHLTRLFEAGQFRMDNASFLYVVMEAADEDLSQILPQRALAPDEVKELLLPLLDALSFLHGKGLIHGRIKPSNVLAVGEQLKLSSDQITSHADPNSVPRRRDAYDAPESAAGIVSRASDMWSLGVTIVAALTQKVDVSAEPALPETIPQPFRGIARECLHLDPQRRASISDIQARLQPQARSVAVTPEVPQMPGGGPVNRWLIMGATIVILAIVGIAVFHSRGTSKAANATSAPQATVQRQPDAPAVATPTSVPPTAAPSTKPSDTAPPPKTAPSRGDILHQVIPDVPQSARNTIQGTIKINVRVQVDPAGKVTSAKLTTAGPSKYFANLALRAAERWEFSAPAPDGQPSPSAWTIQFRFKRSGTQAVPERAKG
jgi:TonB family protein